MAHFEVKFDQTDSPYQDTSQTALWFELYKDGQLTHSFHVVRSWVAFVAVAQALGGGDTAKERAREALAQATGRHLERQACGSRLVLRSGSLLDVPLSDIEWERVAQEAGDFPSLVADATIYQFDADVDADVDAAS